MLNRADYLKACAIIDCFGASLAVRLVEWQTLDHAARRTALSDSRFRTRKV